ncbi:MAG: ATP-binding protein [Deltaproteobacteria bacterium]|nr:ATP-binding protein [Deltaproteobacteria bacterium]
MARQFNTAHANRAEWHYTLPPLQRLPPGTEQLVHDRFYFVLHAPRQSGKTTCVLALADKLRADGRYAVIVTSLESARTTVTESAAIARVVMLLRLASDQLPPDEAPPPEAEDAASEPGLRLYRFLKTWSKALRRPLVLFLDEIDTLENDGLISVLSQLRMGYAERPTAFPQSVCIFGMRDVRDYKVASGGSERLGTASPFNIKRESIPVRMFSREEIAALYAQHTAETGQAFTEATIDRVLELTGGQPLLVNALANDVVSGQGWRGAIDVPQIDAAKERIILAWGTHFDSLMARLREDRVRRVLEPIIAGSDVTYADWEDDRYCRDIGLITGPVGDIANPIYREVIARSLAAKHQRDLRIVQGRWTRDDGGLDIDGLRAAFQNFWQEHGEGFVKSEEYHEVAAQLVVMGFLQRVVNGGGQVEREYAAGVKRMDILVKWPRKPADGAVDLYADNFERHLFELKVWYQDKADPLPAALAQVDEYAARVPCASVSVLVFDRRKATVRKKWANRMKVLGEVGSAQGVPVWGWRG